MNSESDREIPLFVAADEGPPLSTEQDALDLVGDAFGAEAQMVVLPIDRLADDFFDLSTRRAGEFVQKFVDYHLRVAIVGDTASRTSGASFRSWVVESNRGRHLTFVDSIDALHARLDAEHSAASG